MHLLICRTVIYLTRTHWLPHMPELPYPLNFRYQPLEPQTPTDSFAGDAAAGFNSSSFSLAGNIEGGDGRAGLDDAAKKEIRRVMKKRGLGFDEARRQVVQDRFRREGIGPDGRPRDPKFVSFS